MTTKRFEFREINEPPIVPKCYDTKKQEYANLFECVDWLNELHEENQKCKEYNGILYANHTKTDRKLVKQISELKQEKEQLKQQIHYLKIVCRNELDDETLKQVMGSLGDVE